MKIAFVHELINDGFAALRPFPTSRAKDFRAMDDAKLRVCAIRGRDCHGGVENHTDTLRHCPSLYCILRNRVRTESTGYCNC